MNIDKDTTVQINKRKTIENNKIVFSNKTIEISDLLIIKNGAFVFNNCSISFFGEEAGIIGVNANINFDRCVFKSQEDMNIKIVSYKDEIEEPAPQNKNKPYEVSVTYMDPDVRFCVPSSTNPININECRFYNIDKCQIFNAEIRSSQFDNCIIYISSYYMSDNIFSKGNLQMYMGRFGSILRCTFENIKCHIENNGN